MKHPKVSVIIPVYNGGRTIERCLNSIIDQTYKNFEVIVVDNNSTDNSGKIIGGFYNKLICVFEPSIGRGAARNAGIKSAKGEIIAMTDSDCIVPKDWLERIIKPILKNKESVVMGSEEDLIKNYWTKNMQKANWKFVKRNIDDGYINHLDTKNFAIKADLMKSLMFDSSLVAFEDFELYLRLKKNRIKFIPEIKVKHNHKTSLIEIVRVNFNRGYWVARIHKKYKADENMTQSISVRNFISFPFWMIYQFTRKPVGESFFTFVSEISWRAGIIFRLVR